jgi:hypothetical protein
VHPQEQRALSVTQRAFSVTWRAFSVTQRALSVTQRELLASPGELSASPSELSASPSELLASPSELLTSPSELLTSPSELLTSPGATPPDAGYAPPPPLPSAAAEQQEAVRRFLVATTAKDCSVMIAMRRTSQVPPTPIQRCKKWRIVTVGISGGREIAHAAVSRRPPVSLDTIVARTGGYAYTARVWDLSIVQGPFSVAPCQTLIVTIRNSSTAVRPTPPPPLSLDRTRTRTLGAVALLARANRADGKQLCCRF